MTLEIGRDKVVYAMSDANEAVATVSPGDRVVFATEDCFSHQITESHQVLGEDFDFSRVNPATGPVWVEGSEPGDVLKVTIERIEMDRQGVVEAHNAFGVLQHRIPGGITEIVKIEDDSILFQETRFELRPMIGVIGVAPDGGESVPCGIPGRHGGNMDTLENTEGSVLRLPVFVEGAKLALGDLHACMGNGEICGTGVEARGKVTLKIELEKGGSPGSPVIERDDAFYFVASAEKVEDAVENAVDRAARFVAEEKGFSFEKAYMLASVACDLGFSQVVNPLKTVKMRVPKSIL